MKQYMNLYGTQTRKMKKYWHKLSKEEQQKLIEGGLTVEELMERFKQPDWCTYINALGGNLGCWSLVWGDIHSEDDCKNCDCYKEFKMGKMYAKGILGRIQLYNNAIQFAEEQGKKIGKMIADTLKPLIPDITYSVGWAEGKVDEICFWSDENNICTIDPHDLSKYRPLEDIIREVFPELAERIDAYHGIYLPEDKAERAKELLKKLRRGTT